MSKEDSDWIHNFKTKEYKKVDFKLCAIRPKDVKIQHVKQSKELNDLWRFFGWDIDLDEVRIEEVKHCNSL